MSQRDITVVTAGLRQPSSTRLLADRLADSAASALRERGAEAQVRVVELRDHAHDLTNQLLTGFPSRDLQQAIDDVTTADGLVVTTPIFTASYSGLFKTFFDVLDEGALAGMPVVAGATGGSERHSLALEHAIRPLFTYLRAVVMPTAVYAATADWGSSGDGSGGPADRIERAAGEFADVIMGRARRDVADPFDEPTPFEQLLAQGRTHGF